MKINNIFRHNVKYSSPKTIRSEVSFEHSISHHSALYFLIYINKKHEYEEGK